MPLNLNRLPFVDEKTGVLLAQPTRDILPLEQHPKQAEALRVNKVHVVLPPAVVVDAASIEENRYWDAYWDRKTA